MLCELHLSTHSLILRRRQIGLSVALDELCAHRPVAYKRTTLFVCFERSSASPGRISEFCWRFLAIRSTSRSADLYPSRYADGLYLSSVASKLTIFFVVCFEWWSVFPRRIFEFSSRFLATRSATCPTCSPTPTAPGTTSTALAPAPGGANCSVDTRPCSLHFTASLALSNPH